MKSAFNWIAENPSKAAGLAYVTPALTFIASGLGDYAQGNKWQGSMRMLSGLGKLAGCFALMAWGDPKISAAQAVNHVDIQDRSLWERLTSPRQAPHEFSGAMSVPSSLLLAFAAIAAPTTTAALIAVSCVAGTIAIMSAERYAKDQQKPLTNHPTLMQQLRTSAAPLMNWVNERPTRAACWFWSLSNGCLIYEGLSKVDWGMVSQGFNALSNPVMSDGLAKGDWALVTTGVGFHSINALRARASKRTQIIPATAC